MVDLVLPAIAGADGVAVEVTVDVDGAIDVHGRVAAAPAATAIAPAPAPEQGSRRRDAGAPYEAAQQRATQGPAGRRIGGIGPGAVSSIGVVARDVDDLRAGLRDGIDGLTRLRLGRHRVLRASAGLQRARRSGLRAQPLDRRRDIGLLAEQRVAQLLRPVELVVHLLQDGREGDQRFHADVPGLVGHGGDGGIALRAGIGLLPARGLDDLERIGRGHQHLRQQRVVVERDRRQDLVELGRRKGLLPGRHRRGCRSLTQSRQRDRRHRRRQRDEEYSAPPAREFGSIARRLDGNPLHGPPPVRQPSSAAQPTAH